MKSEFENALFQECCAALGSQAFVLSREESDNVFDALEKIIPLYRGGSRIDWDQVERKRRASSSTNIASHLRVLMGREFNERIFILWNDASVPVVQSTLSAVVKHFDDVVAVSFETWLYNPDEGYVVECYYLGDIAMGLFKQEDTYEMKMLSLGMNRRSMSDFLMILHDLEYNFATIDTFQLLEEGLLVKLMGVFDAIKRCKSVEEAEIYFTFLALIQSMLATLLYDKKIDAPDGIWTFTKDFDRIDDLRQRAWIFRDIKSGEYQKQYCSNPQECHIA